MKLYDQVILDCLNLTKENRKSLKIRDPQWKDVGAENLIFGSDMAYELGGGRFFQKSLTALTEDETLVPEDQLYLVGPDLPEIQSDCSFSRISLVRVGKDFLGEGDRLYNAVKAVEFTKYHVSPEGYMLRISSGSNKEMARVSKAALDKGLNFETLGNLYRQAFHKNKMVEAVSQIFITDPDFPFDLLEKDIQRALDITKTIDHIFKNAVMNDCKACTLQEICNEVDGLRELHFGQQKYQ